MATATRSRVSEDGAAIRALENNFATALNAGDIDAMTRCSPDPRGHQIPAPDLRSLPTARAARPLDDTSYMLYS